jgi:hypothetical protein
LNKTSPQQGLEPAKNWVAFQARLLSDRRLREQFRHAPKDTAERSGLTGGDLQTAASVDVDALDTQAELLIAKRRHEAQRLLPTTFSNIGEPVKDHFADYAESCWPNGNRYHHRDAAGFCTYLRQHRIPGLCNSEANLVRFEARGAKLSAHPVRDLPIRHRHRPGLQILYRMQGRTRQLAIYLVIS